MAGRMDTEEGMIQRRARRGKQGCASKANGKNQNENVAKNNRTRRRPRRRRSLVMSTRREKKMPCFAAGS